LNWDKELSKNKYKLFNPQNYFLIEKAQSSRSTLCAFYVFVVKSILLNPSDGHIQKKV